jgi:hypothetical protein
MIQNGTHPESPPNPVLPALADVQRDLVDVTTGFHMRLEQLDQHAGRTFEKNGNQDQQGRMDTDRREHHPVAFSSDPEFSILPTPEGEDVDELRHIVLRRSEDEILRALARAEEVGKTAGESGIPKFEGDELKTAGLLQ